MTRINDIPRYNIEPRTRLSVTSRVRVAKDVLYYYNNVLLCHVSDRFINTDNVKN